MAVLLYKWEFKNIEVEFLNVSEKFWSPGLPAIGARKSWDFLIFTVSASTDLSNNMRCMPREDSDQLLHLCSLRTFSVGMEKPLDYWSCAGIMWPHQGWKELKNILFFIQIPFALAHMLVSVWQFPMWKISWNGWQIFIKVVGIYHWDMINTFTPVVLTWTFPSLN